MQRWLGHTSLRCPEEITLGFLWQARSQPSVRNRFPHRRLYIRGGGLSLDLQGGSGGGSSTFLVLGQEKPSGVHLSSSFSFLFKGAHYRQGSAAPMAGGNFLGRVISYLVNEIVVEGLANNPSFQRFAVRTSKAVEEISSKAAQTREEIVEQLKDASKNLDSFKRQ